MSATTTRPSESCSQNQLQNCFVYTLVNTVFGAAAAAIFTTLNPIAGAAFGAASAIGRMGSRSLLQQIGLTGDDTSVKIVKFVLPILCGIGLGATVVSLIGFPLTFAAGAALTLAMIATAIAMSVINNCLAGNSTTQ